METTVRITYPFYKMDAELQDTLMHELAKQIELHEKDGEHNPEDKANSRLAKAVFVITNEKGISIIN